MPRVTAWTDEAKYRVWPSGSAGSRAGGLSKSTSFCTCCTPTCSWVRERRAESVTGLPSELHGFARRLEIVLQVSIVLFVDKFGGEVNFSGNRGWLCAQRRNMCGFWGVAVLLLFVRRESGSKMRILQFYWWVEGVCAKCVRGVGKLEALCTNFRWYVQGSVGFQGARWRWKNR